MGIWRGKWVTTIRFIEHNRHLIKARGIIPAKTRKRLSNALKVIYCHSSLRAFFDRNGFVCHSLKAIQRHASEAYLSEDGLNSRIDYVGIKKNRNRSRGLGFHDSAA